MKDDELRDIITTSRLEMLLRASKCEREGQPEQAQGIRAAIEILDYHIKRVSDARKKQG